MPSLPVSLIVGQIASEKGHVSMYNAQSTGHARNVHALLHLLWQRGRGAEVVRSLVAQVGVREGE